MIWLIIIAVLVVISGVGMFLAYQSGYDNGQYAGIRKASNSYELELTQLRTEHVCRTWTPWSTPEKHAVWRGRRPAIERVQERTCLECNAEDTRIVRARVLLR